MLEMLFSTTTDTASENLITVLFSIMLALVTGAVLSVLYMRTNRQTYSQSLAITLVFMPAVISTIILLVGESIATAFSLAGIFTIIRFRSAPGSSKDILLILFGVGAGLAYGTGLYLYGIVFTGIMAAVQYLLFALHYAEPHGTQLQLTIVAPEGANNEAIFADVLKSYTTSFQLERIGTRDLGSVYELVYSLELAKHTERAGLIDELRRHNSNLNITLGNREVSTLF